VVSVRQRRIKFQDVDSGKTLVFLTNNFRAERRVATLGIIDVFDEAPQLVWSEAS